MCSNFEHSWKNDPAARDAMREAFRSTSFFSKFFYPTRFRRPFSTAHYEMFDLIDQRVEIDGRWVPRYQKLAFAGHRGFGKSSCLNYSFPAKRILFHETEFVIPISKSATEAEMRSEALKAGLLQNNKVRKFFGPMKAEKSRDSMPQDFSKITWMTPTGIRVMPRGSGQGIRGLLSGDYRPDLLIIDDLEDTTKVRGDEYRDFIKEWFFSDILNLVDLSELNWQVVFIGNIVHEDCVLELLMNEPEWITRRYPLCDKEFHSNWLSHMSDLKCQALYEQYKRKGLQDVFAREFFCEPTSGIDARFTDDLLIRYQDDGRSLSKNPEVLNIILCDPARTVGAKACASAVVGCAVDFRNRDIWVRDVVKGHFFPPQYYKEIFDMAERLNAKTIGVEITGLNEYIKVPLENEKRIRGWRGNLIDLTARKDKVARIMSLHPFFANGYVKINDRIADSLFAELKGVGSRKDVDAADALSYIVSIMVEGKKAFYAKEISDTKSEDQIYYDALHEANREMEDIPSLDEMSMV